MGNDFKKKVVYFIDEFVVFLFIVIGIIFSEVIDKTTKGKNVSSHDFHLNFVNILIACVIATMFYGMLNSSFAFNDKNKPPMMKRISSALLQGLGWKSIVTMGIGDN